MSIRALTAASLMLLAVVAQAGPEGRYQAIPIQSGIKYGTEKALILDTVAGHMWIWVESPDVNDEPGGRYVIYQGQLQPGREMGDVMMKQEWEPHAADEAADKP